MIDHRTMNREEPIREEGTSVEESIGLPLEEFFEVAIRGLQDVAPDIGLSPG